MNLLVAFVCVALASVGSTVAHAQSAQGSTAVAAPASSGQRVGVIDFDVHLGPLTLRPVQGPGPTTRLAMRPDRPLQAPTSARPGARARSRKRVVAGAIAGSVGGFFGGGFLGAHIEGDRCNCDDPGVRGFLIGAPIGAVAGGILGGKFLF